MVVTVIETNPRQDGRRPVRRLRQRAIAGRRGREIREGSIFLTNDPYLCDGTIDHTGSYSRRSLMGQSKSRYEVDSSYCMPYLPLSGRSDRCFVLPGRNARIGCVLVRIPNSYPGGGRCRCAGSVLRSRLLRARRSRGGTHLQVGIFWPNQHPVTCPRPSADRVRSDWDDEVSRSDELGACRHEDRSRRTARGR